MNLLWSAHIEETNLWEPHCRGLLIKREGKSMFLYYRSGQVVRVLIESSGLSEPTVLLSDPRVRLPQNWLLSEINNNFLICGEDCYIDLHSMQITDPVPESIQAEYKDKIQTRGLRLVYDDFFFGEYKVSHFGQFGYRCYKGAELIWTFVGQGYLYTDIELYNLQKDFIVFGTDGMGGHFYIVELQSGSVVCDINTHGTNHYVFKNDRFYILSKEKKSVIKCISSLDGSLIDEVVLEGKLNTNSRILQDDNRLVVTTFQYRAGLPKALIIHYLDM